MTTIQEYGVAFGRFQPIHLGHLQYLTLAKKDCRKLIVGITNADPLHIREVDADKDRSSEGSNPFTYFERQQMIQLGLLEAGFRREEFEIVPFPINFPQLIKYYIPADATVHIALLEEWGRSKLQLLESVGLDVQVVDLQSKLTTATEVRRRIKNNESCQELLPQSVVRFILENGLEERIKSL